MKFIWTVLMLALVASSAQAVADDPKIAKFNTSSLKTVSSKASLSTSDPRFGYQAASIAFEKGRAPTEVELGQAWLEVGKVYASFAVNSKNSDIEYFNPEGKFPIAGERGFFKAIDDFTQFNDAFGKLMFKNSWKILGFETGKIYRSEGPFVCAMRGSGLRCDLPGNESTCSDEVEFRIDEPTGFLITGTQAVDSRSSCKKAFHFRELMRITASRAI